MTTLAFVIPAYRRFELARACLRQLRRTCAELAGNGIEATAVIVADDENLETARELGFVAIEQENVVGRRLNDGIEHAAKELGCEYVAPMGSDDWIDAAWFTARPLGRDTIRVHREYTLVHHSGDRAGRCRITYSGGSGIRVFPAALLEPLGFRPADDKKMRAIDTSIHTRLRRAYHRDPRFDYLELDPLQAVGFTSPDEQLNTYDDQYDYFGVDELADPWDHLAERYPAEAVEEVRQVYERRLVTA